MLRKTVIKKPIRDEGVNIETHQLKQTHKQRWAKIRGDSEPTHDSGGNQIKHRLIA